MNSRHAALFSVCMSFKLLMIVSALVLRLPHIGFIGSLFLGIFGHHLSRRDKLWLCLPFALIMTVYGFYQTVQAMSFAKPLMDIMGPIVGYRSVTVEEIEALLRNPKIQVGLMMILAGAAVMQFIAFMVLDWILLSWAGRAVYRLLKSRIRSLREFEQF